MVDSNSIIGTGKDLDFCSNNIGQSCSASRDADFLEPVIFVVDHAGLSRVVDLDGSLGDNGPVWDANVEGEGPGSCDSVVEGVVIIVKLIAFL